ncbi:MAG TPA: hypothetical protein VKZ63_00235 [Kofleriaceae bacterium]|nr:hypothetical protein [Kofleriaceae bacterium]
MELLGRAAVSLLCAAALAGCRGEKRPAPEEVSHQLIEVIEDNLALRTGPVGHGAWRSEATYVLVEAKNNAEGDVMVTLAGDLVGQGGEVIGPLRRESLRVPAGGTRLFALVDQDQKARPAATGARVRVAGAVPATGPAPVVVTDGHVYRDGDRADLNGTVVNSADGTATVVVFFAFFDEAGAPLKRVSTVFRLAPRARRGAHWVGPAGSASGSMFIGDVTY